MKRTLEGDSRIKMIPTMGMEYPLQKLKTIKFF